MSLFYNSIVWSYKSGGMESYPRNPLEVYFRDPTLYFSLWPKDIYEYCLLPFLYDEVQIPLKSQKAQFVGIRKFPPNYEAHILMFLRNGDLIVYKHQENNIARFSPIQQKILWELPDVKPDEVICHPGLDFLIFRLESNIYIRINLVSQVNSLQTMETISSAEYTQMHELARHYKYLGVPTSLMIPPFLSPSYRYGFQETTFHQGYLFQVITVDTTRTLYLHQYF